MTERARMKDQYGVDPSDRQGAGDSSGSSVTNIFTSSSAPSQGGIGCGSAHKPFFASRASCSNPASTESPGAHFRYHHQQFLANS